MSDIDIAAKIKLRAWDIPDKVFLELSPTMKQEGMKGSPSIALCDLEPEVLEAQLQRFCDAVRAKAKPVPSMVISHGPPLRMTNI